MKVRRARFDDIPAIVDMLVKYHPQSNMDEIPVVKKDLVKVLDHHIADIKTCMPLTAWNDDGTLNGVLLAELMPFFFNKRRYFVTDMAFISNGAGMQLLKALKDWFYKTGADKIIMGVSSGHERADAFLELSGLEKTGNMYVLCR